MKIIPAIDLIDGKCTRLVKGDFEQKTIYNEDPVEQAKIFESKGAKYLHLVDLDGAKKGHPVNIEILQKIKANTKLTVDFSGGIKTKNDVEEVFNSGADKIIIGSMAIKNSILFNRIITDFGPKKIILAADTDGEFIMIDAWRTRSNIKLEDHIEGFVKMGGKSVMITDINKDGMLSGSSIQLYKKILSKYNINLIASGGVSSIDEIKILKDINCFGAIIGKSLYEDKLSLKEALNA